MKGRVKIGGGLLREVDRVARELGVSRQRVVSVALTDYLGQLRQHDLVERLNQVYSQPLPEGETSSSSQWRPKFFLALRDRW